MTVARPASLAGALSLALLAAGCTGAPEASRSLTFDATSDKAIVVIGTSTNRAQQEEIRAGRRLSTFWMEFDPARQRLVPGGKTFMTAVEGGVFSAPAYLKPTIAVLAVEPGSYALVGAGFPHLVSTFVPSKENSALQDSLGRRQSWTHTVDPRRHVDPAAEVGRGHYRFSVSAGEILYIGHFEFEKWDYLDSIRSINHSQDEAAARAALAGYPGISGLMVTYDPASPPQSVAR